ncbi:MAG: methyltransferase [Desulfobulbaceae bacterium]|nr:MAG: methyltransferase [Desulfobulbaceae bacterium]
MESRSQKSEAGSAALLRRRFNRAATTYDQYADIQLQALELLIARLQPIDEPAMTLELGCGTGNYTRLLLAHFPRTRLLSLDFSEAMLVQAREKINESPRDYAARLALLCQDGESFLAAKSARFDLITANATLQWFADLPRALALIRAGLQPGGQLLTTIFGRRSLAELEEGLQAVIGEQMHVAAMRFPDYPELAAMLTTVFAEVEISEHRLSRQFSGLSALLRHFRYTGTGGAARAAGFTPRHYRELSRWFRDNYGGFQVSFQVLVVRCQN